MFLDAVFQRVETTGNLRESFIPAVGLGGGAGDRWRRCHGSDFLPQVIGDLFYGISCQSMPFFEKTEEK